MKNTRLRTSMSVHRGGCWFICFALLTLGLRAGDIVFVRHGETEANVSGQYHPSTTNRLTANGRRQAGALPRLLGGERFDYAATSPMSRCLQTIQPLLQAEGMTAAIWPGLAEISRSVLSRANGNKPVIPRGDALKIPPEWRRFFYFESEDDKHSLEPEDRACALRQIQAVASRLRALARPRDARILVVGHSINGSILLNFLLGREPERSLPLSNGAPARLRVAADGKAELLELNGEQLPAHER